MNGVFMREEADMFRNPLRIMIGAMQAWVVHRSARLAALRLDVDAWSQQSAVAWLEEHGRREAAQHLWLRQVQRDGACA